MTKYYDVHKYRPKKAKTDYLNAFIVSTLIALWFGLMVYTFALSKALISIRDLIQAQQTVYKTINR